MKKLMRLWCGLTAFCFVFDMVFAQAAFAAQAPLALPAINAAAPLSASTPCALLRGLKIDPQDPLKFAFIIDPAPGKKVNKEEFRRLVGYFMAALTVPEKDFWVNLSPYEKGRVIPQQLSDTDFGRDLLVQDYVLKQVAASLTYPETKLGKKYWDAINSKGSRSDTVKNFNKVWIMPDKIDVFEDNNLAIVGSAKLKVLTEEDYLATQKNSGRANNPAMNAFKAQILPVLTKEVNEGSNFSSLRQMFYSFALALWFKQKVKDSFYKYYVNQNKTAGIALDDKTIKERVYAKYVEAFKKGAYDYIKKEGVGANGHSLPSNKVTKRQYFSGGVVVAPSGEPAAGEMRPGFSLDTLVKGAVVLAVGSTLGLVNLNCGGLEVPRHAGDASNDHVTMVDSQSTEAGKQDVLARDGITKEVGPDGGVVYTLPSSPDAWIGDVGATTTGAGGSTGIGSNTGTGGASGTNAGGSTSVGSSTNAGGSTSVGGNTNIGGSTGSGGVTGSSSSATGGSTVIKDAGSPDAITADTSEGGSPDLVLLPDATKAIVEPQSETIEPTVEPSVSDGGPDGKPPADAPPARVPGGNYGGIVVPGSDAGVPAAPGSGQAIDPQVNYNAANGNADLLVDTILSGLVPAGFWDASDLGADSVVAMSTQAAIAHLAPWEAAQVLADVIKYLGLSDASGAFIGTSSGNAADIAALALMRGGASLARAAWADHSGAWPAWQALIDQARLDWNSTKNSVSITLAALQIDEKSFYVDEVVRTILDNNRTFEGFKAQNPELFTAAAADFPYELAIAKLRTVLSLSRTVAISLYATNATYMGFNTLGTDAGVYIDPLGVAASIIFIATANTVDPSTDNSYPDPAGPMVLDFNGSQFANQITARSKNLAKGQSLPTGLITSIADFDAYVLGFHVEGTTLAAIASSATPADGGVGINAVTGMAKKSGTEFEEVTQMDIASARALAANPKGNMDIDIGFGRKITAVIVDDAGNSPNRRGFHVRAGGGFPAIIAVKPGLEGNVEAYVEQHERAELIVDYFGRPNIERIAKARHLSYERVLHMVVAAQERAQWIKDGKEGLMLVDDADLRSYDQPKLIDLSKEERALQRGIIEEFYGTKDSDIVVNSATYEARYQKAAATYGGVDLSKAKITTHLGAPVNFKAPLQMVNMFKNAKSYSFEIISVGTPFTLR